MSELNTHATASKTAEQIIDERTFGNLAKMVPLVIIIFGAVITAVSFWVEGGTAAAAQEAIKTFGVVLGMAGAGSATAYFGKSQTQIDLQDLRSANTVRMKTEDGKRVYSLTSDSDLIHGNYSQNREQEDTPAPMVTAPALPVVYPAPVDDSINPGA